MGFLAMGAEDLKALYETGKLSLYAYIRYSAALENRVISSSEAWELSATERGAAIEKALAKTEYKDWYNVGAENNGYFPIIDFQKDNDVVSLKTIDPTLPSYEGDGATTQIFKYLDALNVDIKIDGELANKILDVRIPPGTNDILDINTLLDRAAELKITLKIKEF